MEIIVTINIAIPARLSRKILKLIDSAGISYSNYTSTPHITLHLASFPEKNYISLYKDLRSISIAPLTLKLISVGITENKARNNSFISLKTNQTKALYSLHKQIVHIVNKHREGLIRKKDLLRIKKGTYSKKGISYIKRFGYARILDYFQPHISIGECSKDNKNLDEFKGTLNNFCAEIKNTKIPVLYINLSLYEYDNKKDKYKNMDLDKKIYLQK